MLDRGTSRDGQAHVITALPEPPTIWTDETSGFRRRYLNDLIGISVATRPEPVAWVRW